MLGGGVSVPYWCSLFLRPSPVCDKVMFKHISDVCVHSKWKTCPQYITSGAQQRHRCLRLDKATAPSSLVVVVRCTWPTTPPPPPPVSFSESTVREEESTCGMRQRCISSAYHRNYTGTHLINSRLTGCRCTRHRIVDQCH